MTRYPRRAPHRGWILSGGLIALAALGAAWLASRPHVNDGNGSTAAASTPAMIQPGSHRNRLAREKSPYLLQHASNPVDWYPWGDEAIERARREQKPIFLSIGYSTCHWCHVMERESFENQAVAEALNRDFIAIKVDREERPDVDRIYMTSMQAMGMGGGWPLNVFLTPDLEPFYGGTYFPPDSLHGRAGMLQILPRVAAAWREQRTQIEATGRQVIEALSALDASDRPRSERQGLLDRGYQALAASHDSSHGGFGHAPKFPTVPNLNFLMRVWARDPERNPTARDLALHQLDAMRAGGIHDHLGGGFHRYSTDAGWLVPHFEKMLYDQAQLAWAYLEAFQATGRHAYAATARGIFDYVARDLTAPEGGFYSAEDADTEGEEGRFYVWTPDEIAAVLGDDDASIFAHHYGVTPRGNFEHELSILNEAHSLAETATAFHRPAAEIEPLLARARAKLFAARATRPRPHRDDKVLAAWNGLMISAFARGARVLGDPALAERAERAASFAWKALRDPASGELRRRWREGEAAGRGQLDDYAYLALGCIDLYGASFDPLWLERAVSLTEAAIERFWDEKEGAFFESPAGDPHLKLRMKDDFDGAEMAGNSIAVSNLLVLSALLDRADWRAKAQRTLDAYARRIEAHPIAMPQMLVAMELAESAPRHVVIAGRLEAEDTHAMVAEFNRRFLPHDALLVADGGERVRRLAALVPFAARLEPRRGRATAYVCIDYACRLPTTDPAAFAAQLEERPARKPKEQPIR